MSYYKLSLNVAVASAKIDNLIKTEALGEAHTGSARYVKKVEKVSRALAEQAYAKLAEQIKAKYPSGDAADLAQFWVKERRVEYLGGFREALRVEILRAAGHPTD